MIGCGHLWPDNYYRYLSVFTANQHHSSSCFHAKALIQRQLLTSNHSMLSLGYHLCYSFSGGYNMRSSIEMTSDLADYLDIAMCLVIIILFPSCIEFAKEIQWAGRKNFRLAEPFVNSLCEACFSVTHTHTILSWISKRWGRDAANEPQFERNVASVAPASVSAGADADRCNKGKVKGI